MMKKSIVAGGSYCRRLLQWTRYSRRLGTPAVQPHDSAQGQLVHLDIPHRHAGSQISHRSMSTMEEEKSDAGLEMVKGIGDVRVNVRTSFRTDDSDPTLHSIQHDGLYYKVSSDEYKLYVQDGQFPGYQQQVKTFQECVIMARKPALEVFDIIDNVNLSHPPLRILFYGKNGSGKTLSLSHVVHRYAKQDWLIVQIPMMNLLRFKPMHPREVAPSVYKEGRIDSLEDASLWLQHFRAQNLQHLENIKASKDYTWSKREVSPEGTSLLEIADFAISRKKYASDCVGVILKEVRRVASEKQIKVLVAVDGVNGFWRDVTLRFENKKVVNVEEMSLFHHFRKMLEPTWSNGVCVGTVCAYVGALDTKQSPGSLPYTPQGLLKKKGFEFMDPFIPVLVPEYSTKEIYNCLEYYTERKWIQKPRGLTEAGKKELIFLSNKNPLELMKISGHW